MIDAVTLIGVVGALVIVVAWGVAVKLPPPPLPLSLIYSLGSLLLTIYAVLRGDPVFTALNAAATVLGFLNAWRARTSTRL